MAEEDKPRLETSVKYRFKNMNVVNANWYDYNENCWCALVT